MLFYEAILLLQQIETDESLWNLKAASDVVLFEGFRCEVWPNVSMLTYI